MATIHFLNVKEGDCSIIQHNSGHVTVIDVCNASIPAPKSDSDRAIENALREFITLESAPRGNFNQKKLPVNPIEYLQQYNILSIFRYIQTHPDMDHMDGIESLFTQFSPVNLWDTNNKKEMSEWTGSPYKESDWKFYRDLREGRRDNPPKRLTLFSGDTGQYWNVSSDGSQGGDGIQILSPTSALLEQANRNDGDYNDCSYVLIYRTSEIKAIFAGDSHDNTWEYILANYESDVRNADLLIAPHHGRASGRKYDFLNVVNPVLTFFGNARHEHLAYDAWNNRNLWFVTNNQAGSMVVKADSYPWVLYVTNEKYARKENPNTTYDDHLKAWKIREIEKKT